MPPAGEGMPIFILNPHMQSAKSFINGRSQAVRLPKEFQFSGKDVLIQKVGDMDLLLSAQAKSKKLTLVKNNSREFERIDGLRIENWVPEVMP